MRVIAYQTWRNAELLTYRALPLWDFGLMVIVIQGERVFVLDTDRLVVDINRRGFEPEPLQHVQRLAPQISDGERSRVTQASAVSLDLSDVAVRSMTARMRDFNEGFFRLGRRCPSRNFCTGLPAQRRAPLDRTLPVAAAVQRVGLNGRAGQCPDYVS
jgi:hypothetical protein